MKMAERLKNVDSSRLIECQNIHSTNINQLNDDCLRTIFMKLPLLDRLRVEDVCKRWQEIGSRESWSDIKNVRLTYFNNGWVFEHDPFIRNDLDAKIMDQIFIRCGRFLIKLNISFSRVKIIDETEKNVLQKINKYCYNLKKLELDLSDYKAIDFDSLYLHYGELEVFDISIHRYGTVDWESGLRGLRNEKIREMTLNVEYGEVKDFCPTVISSFPQLKKLILKGFVLGPRNFEVMENHSLTDLILDCCIINPLNDYSIGGFSNLEHLGLFNSTTTPIIDDFFHNLSRNSTKLKSLEIYDCIISERVLSVISQIPTLESLILDNLIIDGRGLAMMKSLKKMECIYCCNFQPENIIALLKNAPNLEELNASISLEILKIANRVTRQRHNGPTLVLWVSSDLLKKFNEQSDEELSPYLSFKVE